MSREDPQMKIRLPADLKDQIEAAAKAAGRSMNAEIVARLEQSFKQEEEGFDLAFRSAVLEDEIKSLEAKLGKKLGATPTADEIADKVAKRLDRMIPIAPGILEEYLERFEQDSRERHRKWWMEQFGYDPEIPPVPQHGGPPARSKNAMHPLKKSASSKPK